MTSLAISNSSQGALVSVQLPSTLNSSSTALVPFPSDTKVSVQSLEEMNLLVKLLDNSTENQLIEKTTMSFQRTLAQRDAECVTLIETIGELKQEFIISESKNKQVIQAKDSEVTALKAENDSLKKALKALEKELADERRKANEREAALRAENTKAIATAVKVADEKGDARVAAARAEGDTRVAAERSAGNTRVAAEQAIRETREHNVRAQINNVAAALDSHGLWYVNIPEVSWGSWKNPKAQADLAAQMVRGITFPR